MQIIINARVVTGYVGSAHLHWLVNIVGAPRVSVALDIATAYVLPANDQCHDGQCMNSYVGDFRWATL